MRPLIKKKFGHENEGYSDINLKFISLLVLSSVLAIVIIIIFLNSYFIQEKERQVFELVLKPESLELRELHAVEYELLNSYKVIDSEKKIYRIPVERAMQLIIKEDFNIKISNTRLKITVKFE
jgi:hypothetical protein